MRCDLELLLDSAKALVWLTKPAACYLVDARTGEFGNRVYSDTMHDATIIWKRLEPENLPLIAAGTNWEDTTVEKKLIARGAELALERGLR